LGNIEKYGVLALIFVIVLILAVAICNGPGETPKPNDTGVNVGAGPSANEVNLRPAVREQLKRQEQEEGKNKPSVVDPNGGVHGSNAGVNNGSVETNPQFKTYVVKKDDTLESIAKAELGARSRWQDIVRANEGLDPKRLKINQQLLLPVSSTGDVVVKTDEKSPIKAATKKSTKPGVIAKN